MSPEPEKRWFITVDYCKKGRRGIFCSRSGESKTFDHQPTEEEMCKFIGAFWLILDPQAIQLSLTELKEYSKWTPLAEYTYQYGIARKETHEPAHS